MTRTWIHFSAPFVLFVLASSGGVSMAETVYRCGNVYSQAPCASGRALEVSDARSAADREEAQQLALAAQRSGDAMERQRLIAESRVRPTAAANLGPATQQATDEHLVNKNKAKVKKKKVRASRTSMDEPADFVAIDPTTIKRRR